ncbi:uncharacterized protein LOC100161530 [Acyrthosiphon pisum]|uniref:Uncharacterized protein n=1 Tax=Acyrthosiphon pisum TaxID=7029 RepID=A0A8R1W283_ACYPI|nr:uncharacterized protein LOC100161530 [Acyrthosiphon pisum]|eukprot:XP_001949703.2 PREDICTED: uncharacterized protein LOC100161530 [Acyrthosiphon pisum]
MYSKRIVISIIVIGCLAHFITCPSTVDNKKQKPKISSKDSAKTDPQGKYSNSPAPTRSRSVSPNNNVDSKGNGNAKSPTNPAAKKPMKPPAPDKKKEPAENTAENPDGDEQLAEEKPAGRIKKVFRRINNFRKKICPFRFFGRLIKKGLGSNKKPKLTDEEGQEVNFDK